MGIKRVAISSNGSAHRNVYESLIYAGVDDFSISLDACCAEDGDRMAGGVKGSWEKVIENLKYITSCAYTTVGVVLTEDNEKRVSDIVRFASECGVDDIRIIPAAQYSSRLYQELSDIEMDNFPILKYRTLATKHNEPVRGISQTDSHKCGLVLDDMAVMGGMHYPCIIYLREGGRPIGKMHRNFRKNRAKWFADHDTHTDPICSKNCLDFCVHYNNKFEEFHAS